MTTTEPYPALSDALKALRDAQLALIRGECDREVLPTHLMTLSLGLMIQWTEEAIGDDPPPPLRLV